MRKSVMLLVSLVAFLSLTVFAHADTITFDDLPSDLDVPISNGYHGLKWNNMYVMDPAAAMEADRDFLQSYYINGIVSQKNIAYNGYGCMAIINTDGVTFDFNGAYFTSAWYDGNILTLDGYQNGSRRYTMNVVLNSGHLWIQADFNGIDELRLYTSNYQFAMDNFTFNKMPVPVPASAWLMFSGLLGLLASRRRLLAWRQTSSGGNS